MRFHFPHRNVTRHVLIVFVFLTCVSFGARSASACTCAQPKDSKPFDLAEAVFVGKVVSVVKPKPRLVDRRRNIYAFSELLVVRFKVTTVWKYVTHTYVTLTTMEQSSACGYHFDAGKTYLVYAYASQDGLNTNLCSETKELSAAESDLKLIGPGQSIRELTRSGGN
jgi:hypothetical protein